MSVIDSLFGVPWEALQEKHLITFLNTAGDEGLTWEVKGDLHRAQWPRREQIEKAVCGFANSRLGGVLIVGAERTDKRQPGWTLSGLTPPPESETALSISRTIRAGVRPTPPFRLKVWRVGEDRQAAIVWIDPVDRPPSITRDGRVYERTTGATEPVTDPAMLTRLFAAGERADAEGDVKASRAMERSLNAAGAIGLVGDFDWNDASSMQGRVGIGLAATAYAADIGGRLFRRSFADALSRQFAGQLRCVRALGSELPDQLSLRQRRESIVARLDPSIGHGHARRFALTASWDGSVGVSCLEVEQGSLALARDDLIEPAWNLAARLVLMLGGTGALRLAIGGKGLMHGGHRWPRLEVPVRRPIDLNGDEDPETFEVAAADIDYVMDELYRHGGEERWLEDKGQN